MFRRCPQRFGPDRSSETSLRDDQDARPPRGSVPKVAGRNARGGVKRKQPLDSDSGLLVKLPTSRLFGRLAVLDAARNPLPVSGVTPAKHREFGTTVGEAVRNHQNL